MLVLHPDHACLVPCMSYPVPVSSDTAKFACSTRNGAGSLGFQETNGQLLVLSEGKDVQWSLDGLDSLIKLLDLLQR